MNIDTSSPEAFAISAAAVAWFCIQAVIRPLFTDNWAWFQSLTSSARSAVWSLVILAAIVPAGLAIYHDWQLVVPLSLSAVLGAQGIHNVVRKASESAG